LARQNNFVGIGFDERVEDLTKWHNRRNDDPKLLWDELRSYYRERVANETPTQAGIQAGQLWNFVIAMKAGDVIVVPESQSRKIQIGHIAGDYYFVEAPADGCHFRHRRAVSWDKQDIDRDSLPEALKTILTAFMTIFSVDKCATEIEHVLGNVSTRSGPVTELLSGQALGTQLLRRLADLPPKSFEQFIGHLFSLEGFEVFVTQFVGDRGVDVAGTLTAGYLANLKLQVQVKRIRSNIGIEEVQRMRGLLRADEHGAIVTLGGFTRQATIAAEDPGMKPIRLIDGEELTDIVLRHFDELSDEYKSFLRLQRRDVPLRDQFIIAPG
jgi:predicted Mrr-cat superfamily restriction endonuclease